MHELIRQFDDVSRRNFVSYAAKTFLGVGAFTMFGAHGSSASAATAGSTSSPGRRAKNVIYLFMNGGMSHLDTFDPGKASEVAGPVQSIKTNADGVMLSQYMPQLAKHMDKAVIVRSLTSVNGAHERGRYVMRTSYNPLATIVHPAMGAWVGKFLGSTGTTLPPNVLVGGEADHPGAGFLEASLSPVRIGNPQEGLQDSTLPEGITAAQFQHRLMLTEKLDKGFRSRYKYDQVNAYTDFYADAVKLMKSKDLAAFDLSQEKQETRAAYGDNFFGQGVLLARRLVENGVRYVEVNYGGWDNHEGIFDSMPQRAGTLDQAVAALLSDLASKGMLQDTLVVIATEFGRTPRINEGQGRDHHPRVFSGLLAGGPVKGGQVYGKSDEKGHAPAENPVQLEDFNATIAHACGIPLDKTVHSKSGRPFTVAHKGKAITSIC